MSEVSDEGYEDKKNYSTYFTWRNQKALSLIHHITIMLTDRNDLKFLRKKVFDCHGKWGRSSQFISMVGDWKNWNDAAFQSHSEENLAQSFAELAGKCEEALKELEELEKLSDNLPTP